MTASPEIRSERPGARATVLLVAALSGAAVMVIELAAVRLLAPWFGTSLVVWTNVIAVILLALAVGYLLGGRLAARRTPLVPLAWALIAAGASVGWLPYLAAICARSFLPPGTALHEAARLVSWGSLAVSCIAFLPPATLLGMVSPLAVESVARLGALTAGRAGGAVLCVSTLGSLAGVFAASHWLLPTLGTRNTFWLAGAGLLVAGALTCLVWRARSRELAPLLALVGLGVAGLVPRPPRPALPDGSVELARADSAYQTLRVVEDRGRDPVLRFLQVNEGFDSFQSVWQERTGLLPEGFYYDDFLLPLGWAPEVESWSVLVLGLGAGTVLRVFEGEHALETEFVGVELDPEAVRLGEEFMGLRPDDPGREVWSGLDARVALACTGRAFDQIVLDCYANQIEIPPHLCTLEFFELLRERLAAGGWLTANLGGFDFDDPVVAAVARTCAAAFDAPVLLVRVPQSRNFVLLARRDEALPLLEGGGIASQTRAIALALGPRTLPGFTRTIVPGSTDGILTDDRCPMESLQLRSIEEARRRRHQGADA